MVQISKPLKPCSELKPSKNSLCNQVLKEKNYVIQATLPRSQPTLEIIGPFLWCRKTTLKINSVLQQGAEYSKQIKKRWRAPPVFRLITSNRLKPIQCARVKQPITTYLRTLWMSKFACPEVNQAKVCEPETNNPQRDPKREPSLKTRCCLIQTTSLGNLVKHLIANAWAARVRTQAYQVAWSWTVSQVLTVAFKRGTIMMLRCLLMIKSLSHQVVGSLE